MTARAVAPRLGALAAATHLGLSLVTCPRDRDVTTMVASDVATQICINWSE